MNADLRRSRCVDCRRFAAVDYYRDARRDLTIVAGTSVSMYAPGGSISNGPFGPGRSVPRPRCVPPAGRSSRARCAVRARMSRAPARTSVTATSAGSGEVLILEDVAARTDGRGVAPGLQPRPERSGLDARGLSAVGARGLLNHHVGVDRLAGGGVGDVDRNRRRLLPFALRRRGLNHLRLPLSAMRSRTARG